MPIFYNPKDDADRISAEAKALASAKHTAGKRSVGQHTNKLVTSAREDVAAAARGESLLRPLRP